MTDRVAEEILTLLLYSYMEDEWVEKVIETISLFFEKKSCRSIS